MGSSVRTLSARPGGVDPADACRRLIGIGRLESVLFGVCGLNSGMGRVVPSDLPDLPKLQSEALSYQFAATGVTPMFAENAGRDGGGLAFPLMYVSVDPSTSRRS